MEILYVRLTTIKLMLTTLLASIIICHGNVIGTVPRVVVLNSPLPYIKVLSGSTVGFTWKFRIIQEKKLKAISWYYSVSEDYWTDGYKLVQSKFKANALNEVSENPRLKPDKRNRVNCTFDHQNQIWIMSCRLTNVKVHDSASYGVKVEYLNDTFKDTYITNTSTLKVIDVVLDKRKSDHIVESWIGKPTVLKCAIHRKVILTTRYKWNVVSEAKDITRGIKKGPSKTSYTFIPLSEQDFGKYKCTIRTAATTVEHEILLQQIHYAGPPEGLRVDITDGGRFVSLFWSQPRKNGGTKILSYEIIVKGEKRETRESTTELSAGVKLTDNSRYEIRVCSINKIGKNENSCTTPREINLAQLPQKGKKDRLKSHLLQILGGIILVFWII